MNVNEITNTIANIENTNKQIMLEIATTPTMRKKNNPYYGRVVKHTAYIGINFGNYTDEVNARRAEENKAADFTAEASRYHTINKYIVELNGNYYLRVLIDKNATIKTIFYLDEEPATDEQITAIKAFFPPKKANTKQNLDNEVQVRVIKIENLVAIGTAEETAAL